MKPVYAKNDMFHFGVAASSAAWGWRNSRSGAAIPKSFGFAAATRPPAPAQRMATKNSRPGVAILVVLFVIMVATIISLSFIARSDTELAFGNNMALRMQMDYLAEAGLTHAKAMLTHPQDSATGSGGYWEGAEAFSLKDLDFYDLLEAGDYYNVVVTRDDSDPADRCNYDVISRAYRLDDGAETAQSYLNARLRLDPCIAYWAGGDTTITNRTTINGDMCCQGNVVNNGTINGDVFADALVGSAEGSLYDPCEANVTWPDFGVDDFTPNYYIDSVAYTPQIYDGNNVFVDFPFSPDVSNPAGVIVCNGNLTLLGNVAIEGTLIVDGDLTVQGENNTVTPVKNYPAIVVYGSEDGNLIIGKNGQLTASGLVQTELMTVRHNAADVIIVGGLFVHDQGIAIDGGHMSSITITAAPMIASTKVSPDGTTANVKRWTPIGGAFFKWLKRE